MDLQSKTWFARGIIPVAVEQQESIATPEMLKPRTCVRCNSRYREIENIGSWKCVEHIYQYDANRKYYPCCKTTKMGCIVCDHTEDIRTPYVGSIIEPSIGPCPVYKVKVDNLKELEKVHDESIRPPPDFEQQKREGQAFVYIFRRCLFGIPVDNRGVYLQ